MFALRKLHFSSSTFGWGSWGVSTTNLGDSMIEAATCLPATIGFGTDLQNYMWHKHLIPTPPRSQAPLDSTNTATSLQTMKPPPSLLAASAALHSMQGRSRGTGRVAHSWWRKKPRGSLRSNQAGRYWLTAGAGASRAKPPTTKNEEGWLPLLKMNTHFLRSILVNRQRIKFWENKLLHEVLTKAWAKTSDDWRTRESKHSVMCDCLLSSITWQLPAIG